MRTHELAVFLREMSDVLMNLPDSEIASLPEALRNSSNSNVDDSFVDDSLNSGKGAKRAKITRAPVDDIFTTLVTLPKKEIVELVDQSSLDVSIRGKDSAKDAANKIKRHLTDHPESSQQVNAILKRRHPPRISEPLSKAMRTLLGN